MVKLLAVEESHYRAAMGQEQLCSLTIPLLKEFPLNRSLLLLRSLRPASK